MATDAISTLVERAGVQAAAVKTATRKRNYLVRLARSEGASLRQIAEATGLSTTHVRNITNGQGV